MASSCVLVTLSSFMLVCHCLHTDGGYVLTNTTSGMLRGKLDLTEQTPVAHFLGVPFAKEPLGELRFGPPQDRNPWSGVRDALNPGKKCMQNSAFDRNQREDMSEDCLFLNVYSPSVSNTSIPVMVWIHGGGYLYGSGSGFNGSFLARQGVVVVTINYRLDMFGFLSMEDDSLPGNYGMLDQIAALKWIQNNIANFGGDPNQVTIFGESAGSSSVSLLILSPLAKGLFQRAILQSGVSFSPWGYQHPGNRVSAKMMARMVALGVNCSDFDNSGKLQSCLQQADAILLLQASRAAVKSFRVEFPITPRVESTFGFLPDLPHKLLMAGSFNHVDTIHGFCSDESALFLMLLSKTFDKPEASMHYWLQWLTELDQQEVYSLMSKHYMANDSMTQQQKSLESQDDIGFLGPIISELNLHVLKAPEKKHYLYEFNYRPSTNNFPSWVSASHGDDVAFIFGYDTERQQNLSNNEKQISDNVMEMWSGFAKNGNPTSIGMPTWSPYTTTQPYYLLIKKIAEEKKWSMFTGEKIYSEFSRRLDGF